jgi:hypothetical protein
MGEVLEREVRRAIQEAGRKEVEARTLFGFAFLLFLVGAALGVALHGEASQVFRETWWMPLRHPSPLLTKDPVVHLAYAFTVILPKNLAVLFVGSVGLPWVGRVLLGEPWPARVYLLTLGFVTGLMATPGGLPHGGAYLLGVLPVAVLEFLAYATGVARGVRAAKESRFPDLILPVGVLVLGSLLETEVIAWWL